VRHLRIIFAMLNRRIVFPLLGLTCFAGFLFAAERGPRAKEFYAKHSEMNSLLAELAQLQIKYRTADETKRAEIQEQWKELVARGNAIEPKLIEAAEKAYAESPNADKNISDFLVALLAERVEADDYEPAAEIGRILMEHEYPEAAAANLAGIAAFAVNDFDAAEKYFTRAAAQGFYQSPPKNDEKAKVGAMFAQLIPHYKTAWEKEKNLRDRETAAGNLPRVLLKTTKGDIELELFENQAPNTVANFISLVHRGFYKDTPFHRVIKGFMAQGGDPTGSGAGGPGYALPSECYRPDHRLHFRGSLSMAHAGRDTGGSLFFLTFVPTPHLDRRHTVFGRMVAGIDVLAKLQRRDPADKEAPRADRILEARVLRSPKPARDYKPEKMPD